MGTFGKLEINSLVWNLKISGRGYGHTPTHAHTGEYLLGHRNESVEVKFVGVPPDGPFYSAQ